MFKHYIRRISLNLINTFSWCEGLHFIKNKKSVRAFKPKADNIYLVRCALLTLLEITLVASS